MSTSPLETFIDVIAWQMPDDPLGRHSPIEGGKFEMIVFLFVLAS
jgi:hypothetical protein